MINDIKENLTTEFLDDFHNYKHTNSYYSQHKNKYDLLNNLGVIKDFDLFLKGDEIKFSNEKIDLLKNILFDKENIKYNTGLQLFISIIEALSLLKEKLTFDVLIDNLDIDKNNFIFDNEILIYSLCLKGADMKITARLLNLFVNYLNTFYDAKDFIKIINLSNSFGYSESNSKSLLNGFIKASSSYNESQRIFYEGSNEGNIYYIDNLVNRSNIINYSFKSCILTYKGEKKVSFYGAELQKKFVEKLFINLNIWICEDDFEGNPLQTLKDIKNKMLYNKFDTIDVKKIFQSFGEDKKRYFIMIG